MRSRPDQVVIIEFGSYACPYSRLFADSVLPVLTRRFLHPGYAAYHFVSVYAEGPHRALALGERCLSSIVGTAEAHRIAITIDSVPADPEESIRRFGQVLGMNDYSSLTECINGQSVQNEVLRLAHMADRANVVATPTFLVGLLRQNGEVVGWPLVGMESPDSLQRLLEAALRTVGRGGDG